MRFGVRRGGLILFRLGGFTGIAAAAAAIYSLAGAGCAGDAFTLQSTPGSSTSGSSSTSIGSSSTSTSSTSSSSTVGAADASTTFCAGYPGYLLCEAFEGGVPGQLQVLDAGTTGTIFADPDSSVPPSTQSMEVTTPALKTAGTTAQTLAGKSFSMIDSDLSLEAEYNLGSNCAKDDTSIALVTAGSSASPGSTYSIVLTVGLSASSVVEILTGPDGGVGVVPHSTTTGVTPNQWTDVKLQIHLLKKTVDLTVGTATLFSGAALSETPAFPLTGTGVTALFAVGAAVSYGDAGALACDLEVDNVLFNATTTLP